MATVPEPFCLRGVNNVTLVMKRDKVFHEMRAALTDFDRWLISRRVDLVGGEENIGNEIQEYVRKL